MKVSKFMCNPRKDQSSFVAQGSWKDFFRQETLNIL